MGPFFFGRIMNVVLFGSTGLVGNLVTKNLINDDKIINLILVTRTPTKFKAQKILNIVDPNLIIKEIPFSIDAAICTLGSTIKKAGSKEAFKNVDLDLVISTAKNVQQFNCPHFLVISSQGASSDSLIFYSKIKGMMERELIKLNFSKLTILRPGLLVGDREELRMGEAAFIHLIKIINPILVGPLKSMKGNKVESVAKCLCDLLDRKDNGIKILEQLDILNYF